MGVEETDAVKGDLERGGGELLVVLEKQEVFAQLLFGELVGRPAEVRRQLPDGAEIGFLRPLAQAGQLQVLLHPGAQGSRLSRSHRQVLSQRSGEPTLRLTVPEHDGPCHAGPAENGKNVNLPSRFDRLQ
jgi:hypothetical protein